MAIRVVRLGSKRAEDEGVRIGTVRRPPRGVKREAYSAQDWYDTWLPILSPSPELMKQGQAAGNEKEWAAFLRKVRKEFSGPEASRTLDLLAALSHQSNFSVGCYCEEESHCHRSVLRELLAERGAAIK